MKNGMSRESQGTYRWDLTVASVTKTRKHYGAGGFKTRIECAYDYLKAVLQHDPKAATLLKGKTAEEQFQLLGVKL